MTSALLVPLVASVFGWRSVFLLLGLVSFAFGIVWVLLAANDPASDPRMPAEEKALFLQAAVEGPSSEKPKASAAAQGEDATVRLRRLFLHPSTVAIITAH